MRKYVAPSFLLLYGWNRKGFFAHTEYRNKALDLYNASLATKEKLVKPEVLFDALGEGLTPISADQNKIEAVSRSDEQLPRASGEELEDEELPVASSSASVSDSLEDIPMDLEAEPSTKLSGPQEDSHHDEEEDLDAEEELEEQPLQRSSRLEAERSEGQWNQVDDIETDVLGAALNKQKLSKNPEESTNG